MYAQTDPPYGIELDSEWRDRAGLNYCGPAEASYMKNRTEGYTETTISGDTRADWSEAFELVPSLEIVYVWHASILTREVLNGLLRIGLVYAGNKRKQPELATQVAEHMREDGLSAREIEVLEQVVAGHRNREIGKRLFISEETVKIHLKHIMEKLGAKDRTHAVAIAGRRGIVRFDCDVSQKATAVSNRASG